MPLLFVCVVLFFGIAQFYQWSSELMLPFPVLLLAGAGLAVISNLRNQRSSLEIPASSHSELVSASQSSAAAVLPPDIRPVVEPRSTAELQLPNLVPPKMAQPGKSISFELNQATQAPAAPDSPLQ